jgi:AcrR family transcriptional regulator
MPNESAQMTERPPQSERPLLRADAVANRARILLTARKIFFRDGAMASLEGIAREAGVGSATLHRHFPGRNALVAAVFRDTILDYAAAAQQISVDYAESEAVWVWLELIVRQCAEEIVMLAALDPDEDHNDETLWHPLEIEGGKLLANARQSGSINSDISIGDLLQITQVIARACDGQPDRAARFMSHLRYGIVSTHAATPSQNRD